MRDYEDGAQRPSKRAMPAAEQDVPEVLLLPSPLDLHLHVGLKATAQGTQTPRNRTAERKILRPPKKFPQPRIPVQVLKLG
jgi:hypothetical protein